MDFGKSQRCSGRLLAREQRHGYTRIKEFASVPGKVREGNPALLLGLIPGLGEAALVARRIPFRSDPWSVSHAEHRVDERGTRSHKSSKLRLPDAAWHPRPAPCGTRATHSTVRIFSSKGGAPENIRGISRHPIRRLSRSSVCSAD